MNKNTIRHVSCLVKKLSIFGKRSFNSRVKQRVILTYHGISKRPYSNCVTQDLFRQQISWLKKKYTVVALSTLVENLSSPLQNRADLAAITFDDGYVNFADLAVPVLQDLECHATLFVPTGRVGHYNDWDQDTNSFYRMAIMSYDQLRQLPHGFVEIGSHGISHAPLNRLPFNQITKEIVESRSDLEYNLGRPVRFFAFPFGAYPFQHKSRLYGNERGVLSVYRASCTTWWGRYNSLKDIHTLYRIGIWHHDSFADFVDKLSGYYDWLKGKESVGRFLKAIRGFL